MEPGSKPRLRVTVTDGRGTAVRAPGLASWLSGVARARARGEIAIALVSDARIRALNKQFRRRDEITDVLSFPAADRDASSFDPRRATHGPQSSMADRRAASRARRPPVPGASSSNPDSHPLGDIVIASGVARRQARAAGHGYAAELRVLALHGFLHLLGYDHHDPADKGRMARLERRLRRQGGLAAGLIERAHATAGASTRRTRHR
ncbi:MAG: rRNA maturation RNase YbeY [Vicinamibacterales bacterium]